MHHVTSWTLWGVVKSMIALPKSAEGRRDAILLVFEDAKVAVVSWCPTSHSLHTISLHDFQAGERAEITLPPPSDDHCSSSLPLLSLHRNNSFLYSLR